MYNILNKFEENTFLTTDNKLATLAQKGKLLLGFYKAECSRFKF